MRTRELIALAACSSLFLAACQQSADVTPPAEETTMEAPADDGAMDNGAEAVVEVEAEGEAVAE